MFTAGKVVLELEGKGPAITRWACKVTRIAHTDPDPRHKQAADLPKVAEMGCISSIQRLYVLDWYTCSGAYAVIFSYVVSEPS